MYKVVYKDHEAEFDSLDLAMAHAKELNVCVTIIGNGMELIGVFGADSIENGLCPDGIAYDWKKRRA